MEYTLSSGVKILFHRIPEAITTDIVVNSFNGMKFNEKGDLRNVKLLDEQLVAANKVQKYHSKLIAHGVELVGEIGDYTELEGIGRNWLSKLKYAETDLSMYTLSDEDDLKFIFLKHYAFKSPADYEALSRYTLNNQ